MQYCTSSNTWYQKCSWFSVCVKLIWKRRHCLINLLFLFFHICHYLENLRPEVKPLRTQSQVTSSVWRFYQTSNQEECVTVCLFFFFFYFLKRNKIKNVLDVHYIKARGNLFHDLLFSDYYFVTNIDIVWINLAFWLLKPPN